MLILAAFWLAYNIYRLAALCIDRFKHRAIKKSQVLELLADFCLGINLLLWGLSLNGYLSFKDFVFVIPIAIYLILKIVIKKIK